MLLAGLILSASFGSYSLAQKSIRKPDRAKPPQFQTNEFSGIFFADARSQLQGSATLGGPAQVAEVPMESSGDAGATEVVAKGND
ncbi:MAG: hypothetical protein RLZZ396_1738, partial [Planctomycetota bacterium]